MEEIINRLIVLVQETAPEVWEIGIRQATVDGIWSLILALLFLVGIISFGYVISYWSKRDATKDERNKGKSRWDDDYDKIDYPFAILMGLFSEAFLIFFFVWQLGEGIKHLVNPGYYAIQSLLNLV